jgi:uncharacterized protein (TIGR02271 family)
MTTTDSTPQYLALENGVVVGSDGSDLGKVGQVYTDNDTGAPSWVTVKTGWFGTRESFVPLNSATVQGDSIQVPFDKDTIKGAPHNEAGEPLSADDERELYSYYGLDACAAVDTGRVERPATEASYAEGDRSGREFDSTDSAGTAAEIPTQRVAENTDGGEYLTRSEEQLHVGTERVEAGRARLRKFVVTEQQTVTVPVSREEVRVVREPIAPGDSVDDVAIGEAAADVVLTEERVVVGKEAVPVEKVSLGTETVTEHRDVTESIRKEQIEFDESPVTDNRI